MILGIPLPDRMDKVKERRPLHILKKYAVDGMLLTENEIAAMFQTSEQEASRMRYGQISDAAFLSHSGG